MQRRKVLLPDPDGPIRHITSFGATCMVMPRSTSRRPKLLWTACASTIGFGIALLSLSVRPRADGHVVRRRGRSVVEVEEHVAEALQWRRRQLAR